MCSAPESVQVRDVVPGLDIPRAASGRGSKGPLAGLGKAGVEDSRPMGGGHGVPRLSCLLMT